MQQRTAVLPTLSTILPKGVQSLREVAATEDLHLEEPLELGLEVTCFLQVVSQEFRRGELEGTLHLEPQIEELEKWVTW